MIHPLSDRDLAEPGRLAIAVALVSAPAGRVGFAELGHALGLSEGNLACHLRRLVRADLVAVHVNGGRGRASRTEYAVTATGRARLAALRVDLEAAAQAIASGLESPVQPDSGGTSALQESVGAHEAPARGTAVADASLPSSLVDERFFGLD